jgi:hypothetical protein
MNERIRELYQQAHSIRHYDGDPMREGNPPTVYWQGEVSAEKFAELMIKEFIDVVENLAPMYDDYRDQIEDRFRRDCISQVKHRFIWSDKE